MKKLNIITIVLVIFGIQFSFSQKKDENIGSEVVNIVKPYTPTISDAFKVKETPVLEDEEEQKKGDSEDYGEFPYHLPVREIAAGECYIEIFILV